MVGSTIVRTGTPGADRFAGTGSDWFEFHGVGGNDTYLLRFFDVFVPPPHIPGVVLPGKIVYGHDRAVETAGGGIDTVNLVNHYNPVGFTGIYPGGQVGAKDLANIEVINALATVRSVHGVSTILRWDIAAGADNNVITTPGGFDTVNAGAGNDTLRTGAGNDTLIGGTGIDKMYGGTGNDIYLVDNVHDLVSEAGGGGVDRVVSSVSFRLAPGFENLTLTGHAAVTGIGNGLNNAIVGSTAANALYGGAGNDSLNGAGGADRMFGGAGNDTYFVDNPRDLVGEAGGGGMDRIVSTASINLGAPARALGAIENVTLNGSAALSVVGNALGNAIVGNSGANVIHGMGGDDLLNGGAGADTMFGGAGNDIYTVDNPGDHVNEAVAGSGGIDSVLSSVAFVLPDQVENLLLTGSAAADGTGNVLANGITGNAANNILDGREGNDTLAGGLGSDKFIFDSALDPVANVDTITDFSHRNGVDGIRLDHAVFTRLSTGLLFTSHFHIGTAAADADDYIIYDDQTGDLFYDGDGSVAVAQPILFATLTGHPTLAASDFGVF